MTIKQAAQQALEVQDACNLSGVAFAFGRCMCAICDESNTLGKGTDWKNEHPIVTLFLLKMAELNGCGSTLHDSYDIADILCKIIAGNNGLRAAVIDSNQLPEAMKCYLP